MVNKGNTFTSPSCHKACLFATFSVSSLMRYLPLGTQHHDIKVDSLMIPRFVPAD